MLVPHNTNSKIKLSPPVLHQVHLVGDLKDDGVVDVIARSGGEDQYPGGVSSSSSGRQ